MEMIKGSFRDPGGFVAKHDGNILRFMTEQAQKEFQYVIETGFLDTLVESNRLVSWQSANIDELKTHIQNNSLYNQYRYCVRHPVIPFLSYPYEWCFNALKKAALFHLELQIQALEKSIVLSDATAYNIQFLGTDPIFVDHLSFKPYKEGTPWLAHNQFCIQFLYPLVFSAATGLHFGLIYRSNMQGIHHDHLLNMLPWHKKLNPSFLMHVTLPNLLKKKETSQAFKNKITSEQCISKKNYGQLLKSLVLMIEKLSLPHEKSLWTEYNGSYCIYDETDVKAKEAFLTDFIKKYSFDSLLDLGCNTGKYAYLASQNGVRQIVGLDSDPLSINHAFSYSAKNNINLLPLVMDLANPSPSQGWLEQERSSFLERFKDKTQAVLALALIHHLRFSSGIPLDQIIDFITGLSSHGVIEFIPKSDPMVGKLLQCREDIFADYSQENFERLLNIRNKIIDKKLVSHTGRHLYIFQRK